MQTLACKNLIQSVRKEQMGDTEYFISASPKVNLIKNVNLGVGSLNVLVDFRCKSKNGDIVGVQGDKDVSIAIENTSLVLYWDGRKEVELLLDNDAVMDKDDLRLVLSCAQYGNKMSVTLLCYEKTKTRGWIKKEIRQETDIPVYVFKDANIRIGDANVAVKRLSISNSPMPESVYMPSSNTYRIYDGSIVYVDADSSF